MTTSRARAAALLAAALALAAPAATRAVTPIGTPSPTTITTPAAGSETVTDAGDAAPNATPPAIPTATPASIATPTTAPPTSAATPIATSTPDATPDATPTATPDASATPTPAATATPTAPQAPPRASQTFWYRPTETADVDLPWNSSILGAFDPWTKARITLMAQKQTFRIEGERATGNVAITRDGNDAKVSYEALRVTHDQLGLRFEWGNWAIAWAQGNATFQEAGSSRSFTAKFNEVTVARGFGGWAYDFGVPDIRLGISWPEIYFRGGWAEELTNPSPDIKSMNLFTVGAGISVVGLRFTIGDLVVGEVRVGHFGGHAIGRTLKYRATGTEGGDQDDAVLQTGVTKDWLPTFRIGIAL